MSNLLFQQACALHQRGHLAEAASLYRQILQVSPKQVETLNLLGLLCCQLGELPEGIRLLKKCVKLKPDFGAAQGNLGKALSRAGDTKGALAVLQRLVALEPGNALALVDLARALLDLERGVEALGRLQRAAELAPDHADIAFQWGLALMELRRYEDAAVQYRRALALDPKNVQALNNLGLLCVNVLGQLEEAETYFRRAIECDPFSAQPMANLGGVLRVRGRLQEAEAHCRQALAINPNQISARVSLGTIFLDQGRYHEACACFEHPDALADPGWFSVCCSAMFVSHFVTESRPGECLDKARKVGLRLSKSVRKRFSAWKADPSPTRLRVGLVSGDFRNHPVGYFLESLLTALADSSVDVLAYTTAINEDDLTRRIRPRFSDWRSIALLDDAEAARRIHDDGVHVLIDLSGYTEGTRLPVFAWKPAPVQVSWLGYFGTTGLPEMDYFLADEVGVPKSDAALQFSEAVWYLPETRLCFTPPADAVPVGPLPAQGTGALTFGCFQSPAKISDAVLTVWARVLGELPTAVFRLQAKPYTDSSFADDFLKRCEQCGIPRSKIRLLGETPREAYLEAHNEVDMILDTFPYPGGTTTCEALWMGVPTLTLRGRNLLSNQGASLLNAAGLHEWTAGDVDDYVRKAVAFASDTNRLSLLRAGLRAQVLASPLFDAARFARHFEESLWGMWRARKGAKSGFV